MDTVLFIMGPDDREPTPRMMDDLRADYYGASVIPHRIQGSKLMSNDLKSTCEKNKATIVVFASIDFLSETLANDCDFNPSEFGVERFVWLRRDAFGAETYTLRPRHPAFPADEQLVRKFLGS